VAIAAVVLATQWAIPVPAAERPSEARLVSDVETLQPGKPFRLGVVITLQAHWHTYWLNPGDSGMAPALDWRLPDGFTAEPVLWPAPKLLEEPPLLSFGYEHEVLLFREVRPPEGLKAGASCTFEVRAEWLACNQVCMPLTGQLTLTLQVSAKPPRISMQNQPLFDRVQRNLPVQDRAWTFRALADRATLVLCAAPPAAVPTDIVTCSTFFPAQQDLVKYGRSTWTRTNGAYRLRLERLSEGGRLPASLQGVLVLPAAAPREAEALEVNAPVTPAAGDVGP
jgi:DsbC/DsbD-like thiol-disulfide interchange protein